MDKNSENAIVNAIGELGVKMDHMSDKMGHMNDKMEQLTDNVSTHGKTVVNRLDSINDKLDLAINLNHRVEKLEKAVFGK